MSARARLRIDRHPFGRALLLAVAAVASAVAALVLNVVTPRRPSLGEAAFERSVWELLPRIVEAGLPYALIGAVLGWFGAVFTLLDTRLRVTVPIVVLAGLSVALLAPTGVPMFDAPLVLIAVWTAQIACRLHFELEHRRRVERHRLTGRSLRVLVLVALGCTGLSAAVALIELALMLGFAWWSLLAHPFALVTAAWIALLCGALWLLVALKTLEPRDLRATLPTAAFVTVFVVALLTPLAGPLAALPALMAGCATMVLGHRASAARPGLAR